MPLNKNNFVRDIIPAGSAGVPRRYEPKKTKKENPEDSPKITPPAKTNFGITDFSRLKIILAVVLIYVVFLFAVDFFSKAVVTLALKNEKLEINSLLNIGGGNSNVQTEGVLFEDSVEASAKATEIKELKDKASGIIIVYNAYSSEVQELSSRTRFETPDGKIFRIAGAVKIPGAKVVDGKIEPSSIEIEVAAEEPGQNYNIGLSDFVIPGFEGTPKYDKFYGRSKTPMTGGFIGQATVVSEKDIEDLRKNLEENLRQKLSSRMQLELPEGFFMPEGVLTYEIKIKSVEPAVGRQTEEFKVVLSGELKAFFVRKEDVEKKLLEPYKDDPAFENIGIVNFDQLKLSAENPDFKNLTFKLRALGQARVVWQVDTGRLARELALAATSGKRLGVFAGYTQIKSASISYRPSWWPIFPNDGEKILIQSSYQRD